MREACVINGRPGRSREAGSIPDPRDSAWQHEQGYCPKGGARGRVAHLLKVLAKLGGLDQLPV